MNITWRCVATVVLTGVALAMTPVSSPAVQMVNREVLRRTTGAAVQPGAIKIVSSAGVRPVGASSDSIIRVGDRELLAVRSEAAGRIIRQENAARWVLPYHVVLGRSTPGDAPDEPAAPDLRLIAEVEGGGLRFRPAAGRFIGKLFVGLENARRPEATDVLPVPVAIHLTADADGIDPNQLNIDRTNVASLQPVTVEQIEARDSIQVRVRPSFDPDGVNLWLPVKNSRVQLHSSPIKLQGFGLEVAQLIARLPPGIRPDGHVIFTSNAGTPEPPEALTGSGVVSAVIRSRSPGIARVTAECMPFLPGTVDLAFVWPVAFILAALIGGLLGGTVGHLRRLDRAKIQWVAYVVSGTIVGFVVGIAWAIGINLLPPTAAIQVRVSEAAVFVIAFLGGMFGLHHLIARFGKA